MTHFDVAGQQHGLYRIGQVQQTQQVGGCAARTADGLCRLLVGVIELVDQTLDGACLFQRVQVLALDVLDQRQGQCVFVADLLDDHRHRGQLGQRGRAETALTRDDLVPAIVEGPDHQRLQQAMLVNRVGQFLQRRFVHSRTRLVAAGLQQVQCNLADPFLCASGRRGCWCFDGRRRHRRRGCFVQHRGVASQ